MGFFGPYSYVKKVTKEKFFLHVKERGKVKLYYFSKEPAGALGGLPKGLEVFENNRTGWPMTRKVAKKEEAEKK